MQRDDVYLLDILDSARTALQYVAGKSRSEFLSDRQCQDAVIRRLGKPWRTTYLSLSHASSLCFQGGLTLPAK